MENNFEVRDLRKKEKFVVDDYYLNGYAKLCGIYATGVYVSLCRHANKEQKCWPSIKKIAEELRISETQVRRAVKILIQYNIVAVERLGKKLNNRYWLKDKSEWSDRTLTDSPYRTLTPSLQDTHPLPDRTLHSKETHIKETHSKVIAPTSGAEWNSNIYTEQLLKDKQRHIRIIGFYWKEKQYNFPTKKAAELELNRNLRPARELAEYPNEQITTAFNYVEQKWPDFTLETITKYIHPERQV